jgi:hypothetical protein
MDNLHTPSKESKKKFTGNLSKCCQAPVRIEGDKEGTQYYACSVCDEPCDIIPAPSEDRREKIADLAHNFAKRTLAGEFISSLEFADSILALDKER